MSSDHSGFLVSAPWRSSGKTLLTIGLARAALRRQLSIQTFKKGPDYIDPLWLAAASGTGCYNLDPYIQSEGELLATYSNHTDAGSLALVEGTMGLHDGLSSDGSDSNAAIAVRLDLPVLLIVDCRGMHRTVAALINGIHQFDPAVRFAGVVLNRIRSSRHEQKIRLALDRFCELPILGVVPEAREIRIGEQELGLTPAPDFQFADECIDSVADLVSNSCDVDALFNGVAPVSPESASATVTSLPSNLSQPSAADLTPLQKTQIAVPVDPSVNTNITALKQSCAGVKSPHVRIGLARDEAFHFYYRDDLDRLIDAGAELVELSPLRDTFPPDLDGLIIGGGFPERHASALAGNTRFREALHRQIEQGLVVHAECAGLMYLCRSMVLDKGRFDMVGCFHGDVRMRRKPVGRGYMRLRRHPEYCVGEGGVSDNNAEKQSAGKQSAGKQSAGKGNEGRDSAVKHSAVKHNAGEDSVGEDNVVNAHEFHHSEITFDAEPGFMYEVVRGHGVNGAADGIFYRNVHASYAHFRHTSATPWVDCFLRRVTAALGLRSAGAQADRTSKGQHRRLPCSQ